MNTKKVSIPGFSNLYATKDGNIYYKGKKEPLNQYCNSVTGYMYVSINGRSVAVHRLIALTFLEMPVHNPDGTPFRGKVELNHKDENKQNNSASNLEYCDHIYNCNYGTRIKRLSKGSIMCNETGIIYNSAKECAFALDIDAGNLCRHLQGSTKYSNINGYTFRRV